MWAEHIGSALADFSGMKAIDAEKELVRKEKKTTYHLSKFYITKREKYWIDKTLDMNIHCTYSAALSFAIVQTVHQHSLLLGPK